MAVFFSADVGKCGKSGKSVENYVFLIIAKTTKIGDIEEFLVKSTF